MKDYSTKIEFNEPLSRDCCCLRFSVDWKSFEPGQFVMVGIPGNKVFLRRPFGIVRLEKSVAEICYKIVGQGTQALSEAKVGTKLNVLGPCGKGFSLPSSKETAVLIAGGYGVGPLFGLCKKIIKNKRQLDDSLRLAAGLPPSPLRGEGRERVTTSPHPNLLPQGEKGCDCIFYYGAKSSSDLLYLNELAKLGANVVLSTEDGSRGARGLVTEALEKDISKIKDASLFTCGPHGLLDAVAKIARKYKLPAQVSMESHMACGIGVCMGCVCKNAKGEFVRVCREGPVFDLKQIMQKSKIKNQNDNAN